MVFNVSEYSKRTSFEDVKAWAVAPRETFVLCSILVGCVGGELLVCWKDQLAVGKLYF